MAQRYTIQGTVNDGDFFSPPMNAQYSKAEMSSIIFYSDEYKTQVKPTAGNVQFTMTADGDNYRTTENGTFQAADAYLDTRKPPNGANLAVRAKISLTGVTGATHFRATVWRSV